MAKILIIGAGLSGLSAARELQNNGHEVVVVDKGRGLGGRMATRREGDATFDHGAQFFTARSDRFQKEVESWQNAGVAKEWFDGFPSPRNEKPNDRYPRFCGTRGMTAIGKYLAQGLDVRLGEEIETLRFAENFNGGLWTARSKGGLEYSGNYLLLTAPTPQSLALFDSSGQSLSQAARGVLQSVRFEPCFAVLAILKGASKIPTPGALYVNAEPIYWLADNFQKGVSERFGAVTIHSTGNFARQNYDADQTRVGEVLLDAAREFIGAPDENSVASFQVRRWRFSKPENPLDVGAVFDADLNVCFAGDGLNGAKIEGAWCSGLEAARMINEKAGQ